MMYTDPWPGLPDPELNSGFYENVAPKRLLAWVVDTVLVAILTALAVLFTAFVGLLILPLIFLTINFLYRWATLAGGSATWGMRLGAIEFRDGSGGRLDATTAFAHTLGYTVSVAMVFPQIVSVALMLTTARGQGLSDLVLGTAAINRPARH